MPKGTKIRVTKPETTTKKPEELKVPEIETHVARFYLMGTSPLLVNNFNEKTQRQLEDQSTGAVVKSKLGGRGKPPRDPQAEFQGARIMDSKGRDCFPARWVKAALVTAAGMADIEPSKKDVRQTVFVHGDLLPIETSNGKTAVPVMASDWVRRGRFGSKVPMLAYRAKFDEWQIKIEVQFEPRFVSHAWLIYLIRRAGLSVGLGEWRPEKNGEMGRFDIRIGG